MPVMCGISTHSSLYSKVDLAIKKKDFPVELDCTGTVLTTSMFCRFVIQINKRVRAAGGSTRLINVSDLMYEGLKVLSIDNIIEIYKEPHGRKSKQR